MTYKRLKCKEFANLFGALEEDLAHAAGDLLNSSSLSYQVIQGKDRDKIFLDIIKLLDTEQFKPSGPNRYNEWENGWGENLVEFISSKFNPEKLRPKYYNKNRPCRLLGNYVQGESIDFTYAVTDIFRRWLFDRWFSNLSSLHEFGCGTGHNLVVAAELFPEMPLYGYDWAKSSQKILSRLHDKLGFNINGKFFDFFDSKQNFHLGSGAGVLTFGALEQVGGEFEPFLERLLKARPAICVNVEGIAELYDKCNLFDYIAYKYHRSRNYLRGYLTALKKLEKHGTIEILEINRQRFGNIYDDPHSHIVWRPI